MQTIRHYKLLPLTAILLLGLAARPAGGQATGVNDNSTVPAPPIGALNVIPTHDTSLPIVNIAHYVLYPTIQVNCPPYGGDLSAPVAAAMAIVNSNGGIVDARRCAGTSTWSTAVAIPQNNIKLLLPCATINASQTLTVPAATNNVVIRGCAYQGGSNASSTAGGTVWNMTAAVPAFTVGDQTDQVNTTGFTLTDMLIRTTSAPGPYAAILISRTQELDLERLYILGDGGLDQDGIEIGGYENYSGGTFNSIHISGYDFALWLTGDSTGASNASTFTRLHIDCPTSSGAPIAGTVGIYLPYGDGNTFTGGDIEGCATAIELGAGATDNTFNGVRTENSTTQVDALTGSSYNLWIGGGTLFTGAVTDAGTHNSFQDAFHRGTNNLNGDIWRSQADTTVENHIYTGIGLGNVRGRQDEWTTDVPGAPGSYQNAWLWGPGDGTSGAQVWSLNDLLNNATRFAAAQLTTAGGNNQTYLNGAGTGNVCFQCSANSGTGGVAFGSGGTSPTTVGNIDSAGNESLLGSLEFFNAATLAYQWECSSGTSCTLYNSNATTPGRVFVSYPNGQTDIDSQGAAALTINGTATGGTGGFIVYKGGANYGTAAFDVSGLGAWWSLGNGEVGTVSGTGNLQIGNHLNQIAANDFAGACTMSSGTTCSIGLQHSYTAVTCYCAEQGTAPMACSAEVVSGDIVITAASANSNTWGGFCIGNPQ